MINEKEKLTIGQKICKAMAHKSVVNCPKNGYMQSQNYKYFKADDVVKAASEAFCEFGIIMIIEETEYEHIVYDKQTSSGAKISSHYFIIKGRATFINADDLNDRISMYFLGSAEDSSDKAIGKANTYAKKIALMNILMIQDGEDTDSVGSEDAKISAIQTKQFKAASAFEAQKKNDLSVEVEKQKCGFSVEVENQEVQGRLLKKFFKRGFKPNNFYYYSSPEHAAKVEEFLLTLGLEQNQQTGVYTIKGY